MTPCILIATALLGCPETDAPPQLWEWQPHAIASHAAATPRQDPWLAEDKLRHFAMSFATTAFVYAGARSALEPDHALWAAAATAIAAGVGKEIHDARAGGWFSLRDMAWNLAGVTMGLALVHHTR